jgi:hypothetical protein
LTVSCNTSSSSSRWLVTAAIALFASRMCGLSMPNGNGP